MKIPAHSREGEAARATSAARIASTARPGGPQAARGATSSGAAAAAEHEVAPAPPPHGGFSFARVAVNAPAPGSLPVSRPDDPEEIEAERMAEQIAARIEGGGEAPPSAQGAPRPASSSGLVQPACEACTAERRCEACKKKIQRERGADRGATARDQPARVEHPVPPGQGRLLDPEVRRAFEPHFGVNFGRVRVHAGPSAAAAAERLYARAFTVGSNIVFNRGEYAPEAPAGRRLLAHELAHVVQQGGAPPAVQRKEAPPAESAAAAPAAWLIDEAAAPAPGQMHVVAFLDQLEAAVRAAVREGVAGTPFSERECPYFDLYFGFFRTQSAEYNERALRKYLDGSARVSSAADYIPLVVARVRRAVARWASTGEVPEVPADLSAALSPKADGAGPVQRKERGSAGAVAANPARIQAQLGSGQALDGSVRSRMESAFEQDFSDVRVHTGARAGSLSAQLDARAFTVGRDVAFADGEFRPGTLIGDALLAHELAHVLQQRDGEAGPAAKGEHPSPEGALEQDADEAAVGAVLSLWTGAKRLLSGIARKVMPRLKTGLKLQRCSGGGKCPDGYAWQVVMRAYTVLGCECLWRCQKYTTGLAFEPAFKQPPWYIPGQFWYSGAVAAGETIASPHCFCATPPEDLAGGSIFQDRMGGAPEIDPSNFLGNLPGGAGRAAAKGSMPERSGVTIKSGKIVEPPGIHGQPPKQLENKGNQAKTVEIETITSQKGGSWKPLAYGTLSAEVRGVFKPADVEMISQQGEALGLSAKQIGDFLEMGAISKPGKTPPKLTLSVDDVVAQMKNWKTVIERRGYPYLFKTPESFGQFKIQLTGLLKKHGLPDGKVVVQGSSLRTPQAKDVDVGIFVSDAIFEQYAAQCRSGILQRAKNPKAADKIVKELDEHVKQGFIPKFMFDRPREGASFNSELHDVIEQPFGVQLDISVMKSSSKLALYPSLDM